MSLNGFFAAKRRGLRTFIEDNSSQSAETLPVSGGQNADCSILGSLQFLNLHDLSGQVVKGGELASSGSEVSHARELLASGCIVESDEINRKDFGIKNLKLITKSAYSNQGTVELHFLKAYDSSSQRIKYPSHIPHHPPFPLSLNQPSLENQLPDSRSASPSSGHLCPTTYKAAPTLFSHSTPAMSPLAPSP